MASHSGSSMKGILRAITDGSLCATPCVVISNNANAVALEIARSFGLPAHHLSQKKIGSASDLDFAICETLTRAGTNIVVLSGYLRKLGPLTTNNFRGRILNIHPSLLPKYGGQGMHGSRVHDAVIASGDRLTGASVHIADAEYDTGPVIAQRSVVVMPNDSSAQLGNRVAALEPGLFVETLRAISQGEIDLDDLQA